MLFVENASRGQGIGRQLVRHAIEVLQATRVDVNEANTAASDSMSAWIPRRVPF